MKKNKTEIQLRLRCINVPNMSDWRKRFCLTLYHVSGVTMVPTTTAEQLEPVFKNLVQNVPVTEISYADIQEMLLIWIRNFGTNNFLAFLNVWQEHREEYLYVLADNAIKEYMREVLASKIGIETKLSIIGDLKIYLSSHPDSLPELENDLLNGENFEDVIGLIEAESKLLTPNFDDIFSKLENLLTIKVVASKFAGLETEGVNFKSDFTGLSVNAYVLSYVESLLASFEDDETEEFSANFKWLSKNIAKGNPKLKISENQVRNACLHLLEKLLIWLVQPKEVNLSGMFQIFALASAMQQNDLISEELFAQIKGRIENRLKETDEARADRNWTAYYLESFQRDIKLFV